MRMNDYHRPGLWPGLMLATIGGGLLAREFGLLPAHVHWVDFWPLVFVFIGIPRLVRARDAMGALFALGFVALGGLLLARNLGLLAFHVTRLWPGLLVLLGIAFLIRALRSPERRDPPPDAPVDVDLNPYDELDGGGGALDPVSDGTTQHRFRANDDRLQKEVTFSGLDFKIESQAWKGGSLDVTAGGVGLDLRYARLAPEGALLRVHVVMGGVDIRVPDTWQVQCDVTPLLGGADDTTRPTQGSGSAPVLRVVGSVTLGGLSIRN